jgi:anthranilate phosphoribosyltransferase
MAEGQPSPFRDIDPRARASSLRQAKDLKQGAMLAAKSIEAGEAEGRLDRLIAVSNSVEA